MEIKKIKKSTIAIIISLIIKILLFINKTQVDNYSLPIFIITFSIVYFIFSLIEISKIKNKKFIKLLIYSFISLVIIIDIMYHTYFGSLATVALLKQIGQVSAIKSSIRELVSPVIIYLVVDTLLVNFYILKSNKDIEVKYFKEVTVSLFLLFALSFSFFMTRDLLPALYHKELFTYHTKDILHTNNKSNAYGLEYLEKVKQLEEKRNKNKKENLKYNGVAKNRNLILLQVEALQNFVVGLEINGQEITPNLNKLVKEKGTLYFDEYFQSIGRGNTSDAEFTTNNSVYPSMQEYTYLQYADNDYYSLPILLKENGYNAYVYHGYKKEFWNREKAYVKQGFDKFISEEDYDVKEEIGFGISDELFFKQSLEYMKEQKEANNGGPIYSFLITLTSHTPYDMDERYHELDLGEKYKGNLVYNYLQAVHYTDKQIGKFIESLKEEDLYDDSVIALYGDHFGVNNASDEVFEPMLDILGVDYNFDHITNIPLIIHIPGEEFNETISYVGSQIDFYPTILNLLGLENEKGLMFGVDIINYGEDNIVRPQTSMRKGSFITKDVFLCFASDGIYENSFAVDRKTRKNIDIKDFKETSQQVIDYINTSNFVLDNNQILNENRNIKIDLSNNNPLQNVIEIGIYDYDKSIEDNFENRSVVKIDLDKLKNIEALTKYLKENENKYALVSTKTDVRSEDNMFRKLRYVDTDFMLEDRYIAEFTDFDDYFFIQRERYKNLFLNLESKDFNKEDLLEFIKVNKIQGILLERDKVDLKFIDELKGLQVEVFFENKDRIVK